MEHDQRRCACRLQNCRYLGRQISNLGACGFGIGTVCFGIVRVMLGQLFCDKIKPDFDISGVHPSMWVKAIMAVALVMAVTVLVVPMAFVIMAVAVLIVLVALVFMSVTVLVVPMAFVIMAVAVLIVPVALVFMSVTVLVVPVALVFMSVTVLVVPVAFVIMAVAVIVVPVVVMVIAMIVIVMPMAVIMTMREILQVQTFGVDKGHNFALRLDPGQGAGHPGGQLFADPENQISFGKCACLRWAKLE